MDSFPLCEQFHRTADGSRVAQCCVDVSKLCCLQTPKIFRVFPWPSVKVQIFLCKKDHGNQWWWTVTDKSWVTLPAFFWQEWSTDHRITPVLQGALGKIVHHSISHHVLRKLAEQHIWMWYMSVLSQQECEPGSLMEEWAMFRMADTS